MAELSTWHCNGCAPVTAVRRDWNMQDSEDGCTLRGFSSGGSSSDDDEAGSPQQLSFLGPVAQPRYIGASPNPPSCLLPCSIFLLHCLGCLLQSC